MPAVSLPSKSIILRIVSYFRTLLLAPLWKAIILIMNNIYSWFLALGWVLFHHREYMTDFLTEPSWSSFVAFWRALAETLVHADNAVYDATVQLMELDASLTAPIVMASSVSAIVSAVLTVLLFVKVFDYGMRGIGWLNDTPRLASFSLAVLIWFLVVASFNDNPFIGFRTLIHNFGAVVETVYDVTPFMEVPENLTGTDSVNTTVPEPDGNMSSSTE